MCIRDRQITVETEHNFEVNSKTYKVSKFEMSRKNDRSVLFLEKETKKTKYILASLISKKVRRSSKSPQHYVPDGSGSRSSTPKHEPGWKTICSSKGAFYFEGEFLISHQYNLDILARQRCEISIEVKITKMNY